MRSRRAELGMSQSQLSQLSNVSMRQVARYEGGNQQPSLPVAVSLAKALSISVDQLAGQYEAPSDLGGKWWSAWELPSDTGNQTRIHTARAHQRGNHLQLDTGEGSFAENPEHSSSVELRLYSSDVLVGTFHTQSNAVRPIGSLFYNLSSDGASAMGRWVGQRPDGSIANGWALLTRSEELAQALVAEITDYEPGFH